MEEDNKEILQNTQSQPQTQHYSHHTNHNVDNALPAMMEVEQDFTSSIKCIILNHAVKGQDFPLLSLTLLWLNDESVVACHVFLNGLDVGLVFSYVQRRAIIKHLMNTGMLDPRWMNMTIHIP